MTQKAISMVRGIAVAGLAALVISGPAMAESSPEVLERIAPIGKVHVAGQPAPVAAPAPAPAPAEQPAPAPAAEAPVPEAAEVAAPAPAVEAPAAAAPAPAAEAPAAAAGGEKIYRTVCFACHDAGVANSPKLGDKEAWQPRIAQGMDVLMNSAINGKTAMPPRGTCMACSDDDLKAAIEFMISKVQ